VLLCDDNKWRAGLALAWFPISAKEGDNVKNIFNPFTSALGQTQMGHQHANEETARRRSPLRDRPLRYAGQSIDEKIDDLWDDFTVYFWVTTTFAALAVSNWILVLTKSSTNPWLSTVVAVAYGTYASLRMWKNRQQAALLKLGRDGERIVAENLEALKQEGAVVLHDIVGEGFNLDHVVCSRRGIYAIETKTRSKPARGNSTVVFDGKKILVDGFEPERDPVGQASALAKWLEETLLASTGKRFAVKPVVVFPGWYVEPNPKGTPVWVLNPKALPTFIHNEPISITESDLHMVVFHLTQYVRSRE
jgi:hypothetical protein